MNEKKMVTLEMFKKYHELLMGYIKGGDDLDLDELLLEEDDEENTSD